MGAVLRHPAQETMAELLTQICEGFLPAFDRFYELAAPFVMGMSCKMLADRMEAEDVCHDVLMAVIADPRRFDPARGPVEAWLAVLTKSRCVDRLRKRKRMVLGAGVPGWCERISEGNEETERRVLTKMEREAVRRALREIPGAQRRLLEEAFYGCRSRRELADKWQVPIGTVKSRVRCGLVQLRHAMERQGWGGRG